MNQRLDGDCEISKKKLKNLFFINLIYYIFLISRAEKSWKTCLSGVNPQVSIQYTTVIHDWALVPTFAPTRPLSQPTEPTNILRGELKKKYLRKNCVFYEALAQKLFSEKLRAYSSALIALKMIVARGFYRLGFDSTPLEYQ